MQYRAGQCITIHCSVECSAEMALCSGPNPQHERSGTHKEVAMDTRVWVEVGLKTFNMEKKCVFSLKNISKFEQ